MRPGPDIGRFITFEGGEGTGKSTQARLLADRLRAAGEKVLLTREPGGAPGAETLRALLLAGAADRWSPAAETLLMYAARDDHLVRAIRPALQRGEWVVCDRFSDSTRAYQGAGGGVEDALIEALEAGVVGDTTPDLTVVLDLPAEAGLARAAARSAADRFEARDPEFHARLRRRFLEIAEADPQRCAVIDAGRPIRLIADDVWSAVEARLRTAA